MDKLKLMVLDTLGALLAIALLIAVFWTGLNFLVWWLKS
jgi:hypothetical protein